MTSGVARQRDQAARIPGAGAHWLLDEDVAARVQGRRGMIEVVAMRRGHDDRVEVVAEQIVDVRRRVRKAKVPLHPRQHLGVEAAHGRHLDIVARGQERHVVGGGPPARPDESEAGLAARMLRPARRLRMIISSERMPTSVRGGLVGSNVSGPVSLVMLRQSPWCQTRAAGVCMGRVHG